MWHFYSLFAIRQGSVLWFGFERTRPCIDPIYYLISFKALVLCDDYAAD